ncbi:MAG: hypothetical protein VX970_09085 [Planctomycetota bacterium]|nr:hypothetical protein [Planctomycetota bacterium]
MKDRFPRMVKSPLQIISEADQMQIDDRVTNTIVCLLAKGDRENFTFKKNEWTELNQLLDERARIVSMHEDASGRLPDISH